MPSALITGVSGQDGLYLAEFLLAKGYRVHGLVHGADTTKADAVRAEVPGVEVVAGDLTDVPSLLRALDTAEADEVYNLAAVSNVARSWQEGALTTDVTAKGVLNVLEAIRTFAGPDVSRVRFYQASSSEMFGKAQETPQTEHTLLWPRSPYGVAKVFGHHMTINYRESYGMHASSGILFNHESPRRGPEFVTRKVTLGVAAIAQGRQDKLVMGNLDVSRDWGFAGDYVDAMWRMVQQDQPGDYVVATGVSHSIRDLLGCAFGVVGIADWEHYVEQDPALLRPADVTAIVGDPTKAREVLGWTARMDFAGLVRLMVDADLEGGSR